MISKEPTGSDSIRRRHFLRGITGGIAVAALASIPACVEGSRPERKPNIVLIFLDDQGYGDLGVYGCKDLRTPNIDSIAHNGIRCTDGYVSGPVCVPSRVGLLTGCYQQRFGCDDVADPPASALFLSERLKKLGYSTGMMGKWHLNYAGFRAKDTGTCYPLQRGFDEFFGFHEGAHWFLPGDEHAPNMFAKAYSVDLKRGKETVIEDEYLTTAFGREAVSFIERHKEEPFFLYLPFNAVHTPLEATDEDLKRYEHIEGKARRILAAMTASMDDAVGRVLETLRKHGLEKDTLIFYISDNGGHPIANASLNGPLRGMKGSLYEGGIRVPFMMQWKGVLPKGKVYSQPVMSLDVYATSLAAAGDSQPSANIDGINLLPYTQGKKDSEPHESLYWRYIEMRALRKGKWKLIQQNAKRAVELYNLEDDIGEKRNIAKELPDKVKELETTYDAWNKQMKEPKGTAITSIGRLKKLGLWPLKKKQ